MKRRDVRIEKIPRCLIERPQWFCWKSIPRPNAKPTKLPFNAKGWNADSSDPNTWTTFGIALDAFKRNTSTLASAMVFLEDDPYTASTSIDCLDEQGEFIWGKDIVNRIVRIAKCRRRAMASR